MPNAMSYMIIKKAQEIKRKLPPRTEATMEGYPDYSKSLGHQRKKSPTVAGIERGAGVGITGAALGAVIARVISKRPEVVAGGALAGGALGAGLGFSSGKREAASDYSKLLFLRRRLGINEPGELDALLKHPALAEAMIQKQSSHVKKAMSPRAANVLKALGTLAAGGIGWLGGSYGTSKLMGYHDDPSARHFGAGLNALGAAGLAGLGLFNPKAFAEMLKNPKALMGVSALAEASPMGISTLNRLAAANKAQAENQIAPSAARALGTSTAQGAAVGAGAAGIAALVNGLRRARTEKEIATDRSRAGMVGADFAKYVLPATLAGGVIGSLKKNDSIS